MRAVGFLIALAVILLLMLLRISISVRSDGDLSLKLGIGILRFTVFPKKEKNIKLSDYKADKFRRRKEKLDEKNAKKKAKKQKKSSDNAVSEAESTCDKDEGEKRDILGLADTVLELVSVFLARFGRHLHINVRRLVIIIGSEDAATTAVVYGAVCGTVQCIVELFGSCFHTKFSKNAEVDVIPDFTSTKTSAAVDITFSLRLWQIFDMLIRTGAAYLKKLLSKEI